MVSERLFREHLRGIPKSVLLRYELCGLPATVESCERVATALVGIQ